MFGSRVEALRGMLRRNPDDPRARFGLALELEREEDWEGVVTELRRYLELTDDEGNAYGRLSRALRELGREDEAREALEAGIEASYRHGHPTMAAEFEQELEEI